jgi:hypothetical protein
MHAAGEGRYGPRLLTDRVLADLQFRAGRLALIVSALHGLQELVPPEDRELRRQMLAAFGRACVVRNLAQAELERRARTG